MPVDERVARSVALEQAYVHDVYEQFYDNPRSKPWPKVEDFLNDLEPGSIICDVDLTRLIDLSCLAARTDPGLSSNPFCTMAAKVIKTRSRQHGDVLNLGCGNGKYLNINSSIFNIGGDKSNRLSELAREKENEVIVLDNLALPFRDESLDAVVSIAVVHHLATTDRRISALRELARVLRIGGKIIISVWAMEQSHRKFESQDVLVPWRRPRHISTPSLELTSTTTNSEDDGQPVYHAYTQTSDSDSNKSGRSKCLVRKRGRNRKGRSIDPGRNSSPSSSSLSSPNETCYSFVRRAIQKLAMGGRRVSAHRPWFLESWTVCTKEPQQKRYDPDGCECYDCMENIQDIPIELRRIDEDELPQRRQTFPSSQLINEIANLKSKSMTNIKTTENNNNNIPNKQTNSNNNGESNKESEKPQNNSKNKLKPKLVKQKKSICEEDAEEALDQPTDMKTLIHLPDLKSSLGKYNRGGVLKQRSLNEELMSTDRLQEKERLRQNIQKQASLNEDLICHRSHAFETFKDSVFYVSTSKRFQLIKSGFTNKFKTSSTIERVTGTSLKNGFVRMFQNWKSSDVISPTIPEDETVDNVTAPISSTEEKKEDNGNGERRHSKEDGSDSSKDSSLQSDTSVDSEDSFASVIFVPKSDPMSPTNLSPDPTSPRLKNNSVPNSPRIKQSSCPTSPRIKQMPLAIYPLTKQLSSPKPSTESFAEKLENRDHVATESTMKEFPKTLAQKYSVQQIPQFKKTSINTPSMNAAIPSSVSTTTPSVNTMSPSTNSVSPSTNSVSPSMNTATPSVSTTPPSPEKSPVEVAETRNERLKKIRELLNQKPEFGKRSYRKGNYPIVKQSSVTNGKVEAIAKPLPKLLTLELFNPETDDKDSDSSCVSSPDSVDSVISVNGKNSPLNSRFPFPPKYQKQGSRKSLLDAAADVANSLDEAVGKVIKSSSRAKERLQAEEVLSVLERSYSTDTMPLLDADSCASWDEDCQRHLTDFADKLSEKLLQEIDQYQVKNSLENFNDPYINRLSEELHDLSKLSAEIKKQNEYLAKLSASDKLFGKPCVKCKQNECQCVRTKNSLNKNNLRKNCDWECKSENMGEGSVDSFGKCDMKGSESDLDTAVYSSLSVSKTSIKMGTSTDSCDSEKGSSANSMLSSTATSINFGRSIDSTDGFSESQKDTNSMSRNEGSDGGSTASLASCPEWKTLKQGGQDEQVPGISKETSTVSLDSAWSRRSRDKTVPSDTSQDSLPTDNIGGEITYHRYYHVFREGELDQLIEKYVQNLHIISSYYDHASWCVVAEKVQVWTI